MSFNLDIGVTTVVRLLEKRFTSWVAQEESKFGLMTFIVLIQVLLYFETIRRSHSCSKTSFEGFKYTSSTIVRNFIIWLRLFFPGPYAKWRCCEKASRLF